MLTNTSTRPQLLGIDHQGPVRFRELGTGFQGIDWEVLPENLESAIAMVNANGGPDAWEITPL